MWRKGEPPRIGVYRTIPSRSHNVNSGYWQHWNGRFWGYFTTSAEAALAQAGIRSESQDPQWFDTDTENERSEMKIDINRPAKTKAGDPVTFITDKGRGDHPILGYVGGSTTIGAWTKEGHCLNPNCCLVQKKTVWLAENPNGSVGLFLERPHNSTKMAIVKVEYEVGQFDT